jgi:CRP-like cAMP-binding protein
LLPPQEHERVSPLLTRVRLEMSETVIWPDDPIEHVHLPIDAVLSIISHGEDGEMVETGLVGREGTTGLPLFLGSDSVPQRVVCQVPGEGWRMRAADFRREATRPGAFQTVLLRYAQALLMLTSQGVLCNRLHGLDERLARWLLLIHDRVGRDTFSLTHEFIAVMLGVRRAGVTVAMGSLQRAGAVHYRRGEMTVTDRAALEAAACPCYPILAKQFDRLLGAPPAPAGPGA